MMLPEELPWPTDIDARLELLQKFEALAKRNQAEWRAMRDEGLPEPMYVYFALKSAIDLASIRCSILTVLARSGRPDILAQEQECGDDLEKWYVDALHRVGDEELFKFYQENRGECEKLYDRGKEMCLSLSIQREIRHDH